METKTDRYLILKLSERDVKSLTALIEGSDPNYHIHQEFKIEILEKLDKFTI